MITIKDIARESGYSISTVSRVLSSHPDVSETARDKINDIVNKHRFVPNSFAKQLKQQPANAIAIIVKGTTNMLFAAIIENMQILIEKTGYVVIVDYLDEEDNEVLKALQLCRENKPLGLLFLGGNADYFRSDFEQISTPSVLVTNSAQELGFRNLSSVFTDDVSGARCAIDFLIARGHKKIGVIGGNTDSSCTSALRLRGCFESFRKAGLSFDKAKEYQVSRYSFSSAYRAMNRLHSQMTGLSAVFCMSDVMAIGAIRALRDRGISVPEGISVVGYDGIELAEYYNPKIATIKQKHDKLAGRSVELLLECINNGAEAVHEMIEFELLEGGSVLNCPPMQPE